VGAVSLVSIGALYGVMSFTGGGFLVCVRSLYVRSFLLCQFLGLEKIRPWGPSTPKPVVLVRLIACLQALLPQPCLLSSSWWSSRSSSFACFRSYVFISVLCMLLLSYVPSSTVPLMGSPSGSWLLSEPTARCQAPLP